MINDEIELSEAKEECPPPRELTFMEHAENWLQSLPKEDANKFLYGLEIEAVLILFKYFPDHELIKELLRARI